MNATLEAYIQRDQGLGSDDPWDTLNNPVEDAHEVIIINRIELDEHRIRPSRKVALNDLGDLTHSLSDLLVERAALQSHPNVGTRVVAYLLGVHMILERGQYPILNHTGKALIDGGARAILSLSYITQGDASIRSQSSKDLQIQLIQFLHTRVGRRATNCTPYDTNVVNIP